MAGHSRREFLLKLAKGAAYAAPVIRTLAAPDRVTAQSNSTKGQMKGHKNTFTSFLPSFGPSAPSAPWQQKP